jgi:hypothetical protein
VDNGNSKETCTLSLYYHAFQEKEFILNVKRELLFLLIYAARKKKKGLSDGRHHQKLPRVVGKFKE